MKQTWLAPLSKLLMVSALAVAPACKKKDDSGGGGSAAGSANAGGGDTAAKPKTPCAADATKQTAGGFCVKIPPKWHELSVGDFAGKKQYQWKDEFLNHSVGVDVGKYDGNQKAFDADLDTTMAMVKTKKNFTSVDIEGGKFYSYTDEDGIWSASYTHDDKSTYNCHTRESPTDSSPDIPTINAACKTILSL